MIRSLAFADTSAQSTALRAQSLVSEAAAALSSQPDYRFATSVPARQQPPCNCNQTQNVPTTQDWSDDRHHRRFRNQLVMLSVFEYLGHEGFDFPNCSPSQGRCLLSL